MKTIHLSVIALAIFLITSITSCKKDLKEVSITQNDEEDLLSTSTACAITSISGTMNYESQKEVFTYDSLGNPVSIKVSWLEGTGGSDNWVFRYNKNHRLTDRIGFSTRTLGKFFDEWHKYRYNSLGRISAETKYIWGEIVKGKPANYYDSLIIHYTYDNTGRIIEEKWSWGNVYKYSYNARGNLINGRAYDRKKNLHRTHWIWQFIDRDYSVNNCYNTLSYSYSFPHKIMENNLYLQFTNGYSWDGTTTIKYSCY